MLGANLRISYKIFQRRVVHTSASDGHISKSMQSADKKGFSASLNFS